MSEALRLLAAGKLSPHVLEAAVRVPRLEDAVADAVYVLGTSGREALRGRAAVSPEVVTATPADRSNSPPIMSSATATAMIPIVDEP